MDADRRFTRSSWAVLAVAAALLLLDVAQVAFRLTLPTDGWVVYTDLPTGEEGEEEHQFFFYYLLDTPTPLQTGDQLYALEGAPVADPFASTRAQAADLRALWEAGQPVRYTVQRNGQMLDLEVPPQHWTAAALWRNNVAASSDFFSFVLGGILFLAAAFVAFLRRPGNLSARALLLFSISIVATGISSSLPDGLSVALYPLAAWPTSFFSYTIFGILLAPSLLAFALTFPRPKRFLGRWPALGFLPVAAGLLVAVAVYPFNLAVVGWLGSMLMFLASLISLVHSGFTARDAISRAQMRWAVGGLAVGLGLALLTYLQAFNVVTGPLGDLFSNGVSVGFTVIGISLAVAVLRYRLYDIDLIIRRTLIYTVLTAALALVYFGSVVLLQSIFRSATGEVSQLAVVASTLAIAALFAPLRGRVQNFIDRRFYRRKYDAAQTLAGFAATARDETDLDALAGRLVNVVQETMQPEHATLWLREAQD